MTSLKYVPRPQLKNVFCQFELTCLIFFICVTQKRSKKIKQLPSTHVTAFSPTNLFLNRFWGEVRRSSKPHEPVSKTLTTENGIFDLLLKLRFSFSHLTIQVARSCNELLVGIISHVISYEKTSFE